jgi:hypothetical protein
MEDYAVTRKVNKRKRNLIGDAYVHLASGDNRCNSCTASEMTRGEG